MDIRRLFGSPDFFLLAFEPQAAVFAEMDRDAYNRSIFCDARISTKAPPARAPLAPLLDYNAAHPSRAPNIGYIFHVAHCGSTLLARALDVQSTNLVIREPMLLRQLGVQRSAHFGAAPPDDWRKRLTLATTMLDRRYVADGPVIVKANVPVNLMVDELMATNPQQPAITIYFSLEQYLQAILRSPNHRRWVESVSEELKDGIGALVGPGIANQSHAVTAARLWLAQMLVYHAALSKYPNAVSLNAEDLFDTPRETSAAAFRHFGQTVDDAALDAIMAGELFTRYSKNPKVAFDNTARHERRRALAADLAPEIAEARAYVQASGRPLPDRLAKPLVGEPPLLLG
jgi:hypothetical protein